MSALEEDLPTAAAIYRRISKDAEGDDLAVKRQQDELRAYAEHNGLEIVEDFCDRDISGSKGLHRPAYQQLLAAAEQGRIDVILVTEQTRLTRHPRELEDLVELVERTGVKIVALRSGSYDLSTSGGRAMARVIGAFATQEIEQMSERIKAAHQQRREQGMRIGGARPFGYQRVPQVMDINGREQQHLGLDIDPEESAVLREAVRRILDGETIYRIVTDLNERGIPTATGARWASTILKGQLTNPLIAGWVTQGGKIISKGDWEPIVDEDTWAALQARLTTTKRGARPRSYLLSGFIWCGNCGGPLASKSTTDRRGYYCDILRNPDACKKVYVSAPAVEREVSDRFLSLVRGTDIQHLLHDNGDAQEVQDEINALETRRDDLARRYARRRLTEPEWEAARTAVLTELESQRIKLAQIASPTKIPPDLHHVTDETWKATPFELRRELLQLEIQKVLVYPTERRGRTFDVDRVKVIWRKPQRVG